MPARKNPTDPDRNRHHPARPRSIALIGTYVPRQCGIATFTADLTRALDTADPARVSVVALNDVREGYAYPPEVEFEIDQNNLRDYRLAADHLNMSRVDVVCIQHEYGIFGGPDGAHILKLLNQLRMPLVTTLHTVCSSPTAGQREVLRALAARSERLIVMSEMGRHFLVERYGISAESIELVPHGIPDLSFVDPNYYKDQFGVEGKKVILSFGLLSANKGYEHMIRALPEIVERHPDVVYVILGATHPHVLRSEGESYRHRLQELAHTLEVDERVIFHDRYVDLNTLCEFLGAADVYVTPYLNEDQIVSGTLAYALGAGKAVVSTPYWHAKELLAQGRGRLVGFSDHEALAAEINALLDYETERHAMRKAAYLHSRAAVWSKVAKNYLEVFCEVLRQQQAAPRPRFEARTTARHHAALPELQLTHLDRLTDDTGVFQHATYYVPQRAAGYCTDDNARALIVSTLAREHLTGGDHLDLKIVRYLSFLQDAFNPATRSFRNFLGYDRRWREDAGSPDCNGRALWALGVAACEIREERMRKLALRLLHDALPYASRLTDLRSIAFTLLGLNAFATYAGGDRTITGVRAELTDRLARAFANGREDEDWPWPEEVLTYANAHLPHALLVSGQALGDEEMVASSLHALRWLCEVQTIGGYFSPIGSDGWYRRGGTRARFDQQPIEANATFSACVAAYEATGDRYWIDQGMRVFRWFLGGNDLGVALYDPSTGGCRDGLQPQGANDNQGAESTLAWLSVLTQLHALHAAGAVGWTYEGEKEAAATGAAGAGPRGPRSAEALSG